MEADDGTGLLLRPVGLGHLATQREPAPPVGLDEPAPLVAVGVGLHHDDVGDDVGLFDLGHGTSYLLSASVGASVPGVPGKSSEAAPEEQQRRPVAHAQVEHLPDDQFVVTGVVDQLHPAVDPGQAALDERGAGGRRRVPVDALELVAAGHGETSHSSRWWSPSTLTQKLAGPGDPRPAGGGAGRGHGHEGGVEGEGDEALAGEAHRLALLHARHDGHAGGEPAHGVLEAVGVEGHRQSLPRSRPMPSEAALHLDRRCRRPAPARRGEHPVDLARRSGPGRGGTGSAAGPRPRRPPGRRRSSVEWPQSDMVTNSSSVYWAVVDHQVGAVAQLEDLLVHRPAVDRRLVVGDVGQRPPLGLDPEAQGVADVGDGAGLDLDAPDGEVVAIPRGRGSASRLGSRPCEMGKNGGRTMPARTSSERAALLGGAVDVEDGAGVPHRGEERQAEHVVVVQVGEQDGGLQGGAGCQQRGRAGGRRGRGGPSPDRGSGVARLPPPPGRRTYCPRIGVLVGRARARAPDTEEGDSHRRCRLVGRQPGVRTTLRPMDVQTGHRQRRRFRLSRATGRGDGPLALCLHGFPDTAHTWRYLLPRLADAGYHAVAPFLRGYAPTSVPGGRPLRHRDPGPRCLRPPPGPGRWRRTPSSSATTGAPSPPTVPPPTSPSGGAGWSPPPCPPGVDGRRVLHLRPAAPQLVRVLLPDPPGRVRGVDGRLRLHRPPVGRLVPRLRRVVGRGPGEGGAGLTREPERRHRVLPGHVRRPARRPRGGRRPGGRAAPSPPSPRCTSTAPTTAAWASTPSAR